MPVVDPGKLCRILQSITGLRLVGLTEELEGGHFTAIRPKTPVKPFGFCILISRGTRRIEAGVRWDNQAGELLSDVASADEASRRVFCEILRDSAEAGLRIVAEVDGSSIKEVTDFPSSHRWEEVIVECETRLHLIQASPSEIFAKTLKVASACLAMVLSLLNLESVEGYDDLEIQGLPEGARTQVLVNRYERSPVNRAVCLGHFGPNCQACGFNFEEVYGDIGSGFIQIHHVIPVSQLPLGYILNPLKDLVPLCANCHSMVHRCNPSMSLAELGTLLMRNKY